MVLWFTLTVYITQHYDTWQVCACDKQTPLFVIIIQAYMKPVSQITKTIINNQIRKALRLLSNDDKIVNALIPLWHGNIAYHIPDSTVLVVVSLLYNTGPNVAAATTHHKTIT